MLGGRYGTACSGSESESNGKPRPRHKQSIPYYSNNELSSSSSSVSSAVSVLTHARTPSVSRFEHVRAQVAAAASLADVLSKSCDLLYPKTFRARYTLPCTSKSLTTRRNPHGTLIFETSLNESLARFNHPCQQLPRRELLLHCCPSRLDHHRRAGRPQEGL